MPAAPFASSPGKETEPALKDHKACRHGNYDPITDECVCFEGWTTAGITHPFQFMEGICEQYQCESDAKCQEVLGIPGASCPVRGWNCYCGWEWAFYNLGHGWETQHEKGGGQCMGVSYTFSIFIGRVLEAVMRRLWMIFPPLALLLLPFGRKRAMCDHHRPSLWRSIRQLCGMASQCRGGCIASSAYTWDTLKDDFAWTLFVLDIGIWLYVFLAMVWLVTLFTWSVTLSAFVLVVLLGTFMLACIVMVLACILKVVLAICGIVLSPFALCEGALEGACGSACACDGCCDGCCQACCGHCCGACLEACSRSCLEGCVECCCRSTLGSSSLEDADFFEDELLWGGTHADDSCCGCCDGPTRDRRCPDGKRLPDDKRLQCCVTLPLASVLSIIPAVPENAWGGLFGFLMGTHHFAPQCWLYTGGNPLVEFMGMSWRRPADLHQNAVWQSKVRRFLRPLDLYENAEYAEWQFKVRCSLREAADAGASSDSDSPHSPAQSVISVEGARVVRVKRPFDLRTDRSARSSFEDYTRNECWICSQSCEEWDQWLSCHHLFCRDCSSELLRRRMPCPLCRVASSTVLRGHSYSLEGSESESEPDCSAL